MPGAAVSLIRGSDRESAACVFFGAEQAKQPSKTTRCPSGSQLPRARGIRIHLKRRGNAGGTVGSGPRRSEEHHGQAVQKPHHENVKSVPSAVPPLKVVTRTRRLTAAGRAPTAKAQGGSCSTRASQERARPASARVERPPKIDGSSSSSRPSLSRSLSWRRCYSCIDCSRARRQGSGCELVGSCLQA
jgi:hypothetical protein